MNKQVSRRVVGQTKDVGFQIGVRRTFDISPKQAWSLLTSPDGLRLWLGDVGELQVAPGMGYRANDGTEGVIRIVKPGSHLRLGWHPPDWPNDTTLQVRVLPSTVDGRTAISFHQEKLRDAQQRRKMHRHWLGVLDHIEDLIKNMVRIRE